MKIKDLRALLDNMDEVFYCLQDMKEGKVSKGYITRFTKFQELEVTEHNLKMLKSLIAEADDTFDRFSSVQKYHQDGKK